MKPLTKDLARTGALVALATGGVLIPIRLLHRSAAPPAASKPETLAVQTFDIAEDKYVNTIGVAINDSNDIVGTAFDGDKQVRAFVVRNKKAALLPLPKGAPMSVAAGINADGIVVGTVGDDTKARGILWHGDKVGMLISGQKNTAASTVSTKGVSAGVAFDATRDEANFFVTMKGISGSTGPANYLCFSASRNPQMAFEYIIWRSYRGMASGFAGMIWQRPGEGKSIGEFVPQAGSPSGTLVGLAVGKHGPVPAAFQSGKIGLLPKPEGVQLAVPLAASDAGIFVGAGVEGENKVRPIGWSNGKTGFLPVPGGHRGVALGINDAKTVVGSIETEKGEAHAAVWLNGKVLDLNTLVDPDSGWTLVQAKGVNNKGFVVGTAINAKTEKISAFVVGPVK